LLWDPVPILWFLYGAKCKNEYIFTLLWVPAPARKMKLHLAHCYEYLAPANLDLNFLKIVNTVE
jgi:hypothetical protein